MTGKLSHIVVLILMATAVKAQNIYGYVTSSDNKPLSYCTIRLNSVAVTYSDSNGYFDIPFYQDKFDTVEFSYVGYRPQKYIAFTMLNTKNKIMLSHEKSLLPEVVVRSGAVKTLRKSITGDVSRRKRVETYYYTASGSKVGTALRIKDTVSYYLKEINFFINDYQLPETNKDVRITICKCDKHRGEYTPGEPLGVPIIVDLQKQRDWYKVMVDSIFHYPLREKCLFIEFEMLEKSLVYDESQKHHAPYWIEFGTNRYKRTMYFAQNGVLMKTYLLDIWSSLDHNMKMNIVTIHE